MSMVLPLMEQGASSSSSELQQCRTVIDEVSDSLSEIRSHCFSVVSLAQQWRTLQNSFSLAHDEMERKEMELQKRFEAVEIKEREVYDRCEKMEVEDERIVTLGMELQRRESEIEERFEEMKSKEREFELRFEVLESKERDFEERFEVLESKERDFEERFEVLESKERDFEERFEVLESKEREFELRFEVLESKERDFEERLEVLELKENGIEERFDKLMSTEKEIEERFQGLESKEKEIEERFDKVLSTEKEIEERFKVLESKEKEIEERFNVVEERVKFVELKEREIEEGCKKLELKNKKIKWILQDLELKKKHINERCEFIELWEREFNEGRLSPKLGETQELGSKESELNENLSLIMIPVKSAGSTFQKTDIDVIDVDMVDTQRSAGSTFQKTNIDVDMVDTEKSAGSTFQKTEDEKKKAATQPEKAQEKPTQSNASKYSPSREESDSDEEPQTPATPKPKASKKLFVGNLAFSVKESDVREFFKNAESVRLSKVSGIFKGFAHVEFATAEAAKQAMELNAQPLLGRPVRLEFAHEKPLTPQSRESSSFQRGRAKAQTIFVKGFNTNLDEHAIRNALRKHFGSCGNITKVAIPLNYDTGGVKGMAFMEFADSSSFNAALEKDGSDLGGGYYLSVKVAKPRGDITDGSDGSRFSGRGGTDGGVTAMASGKTDNIWG